MANEPPQSHASLACPWAAVGFECIDSSWTALPEVLNANANITTFPHNNVKTEGEAPLSLTRKSENCHAAHVVPTQMATTQGGLRMHTAFQRYRPSGSGKANTQGRHEPLKIS
jgi:hypothetical protein